MTKGKALGIIKIKKVVLTVDGWTPAKECEEIIDELLGGCGDYFFL